MHGTDLMRDRPIAESPRFSPQLLYRAATLYYQQDATQAQVADRLGTSRATVSRLLLRGARVRPAAVPA
jgi:DNA-binding transcriptional regulator LsrR (DeoR family)